MKITLLILMLGLLASVPAQNDWHSLSEALPLAAKQQQPVLVYVSAPWCGPCLTMEAEVFPKAAPLLARFVKARLRYDDNDSRIQLGHRVLTPFEWTQHLGIEATPGFVVLDHAGNVLTQHTGYLDSKSFNLLLAFIATDAYKHASFEVYVSKHG
ncbi:MAG: thioredoxin family protein [Bacteroidota bacterium]